MSDEQTIYISPEDDLTNVRERLEKISTRRVTLVIPNQTQLRSHVAWKLLHARARELGKEVLIVSSDPQVRSVAQAVKFKVAHSLESSPITRSRPSSRASRPGGGGKGRPGRSGRGATRDRPLGPTQQWDTRPEPPVTQPENRKSQVDEAVTGGIDGIDDLSDITEPYVSNYQKPGRKYDTPSDFRFDTTPPIQPLSPEQIDEEPDLLLEDFNLAQDIRQAAMQSRPPEPPVPPETPEAMPPTELPYKRFTLPSVSPDPFASLEDVQPPPMKKEQYGSVSMVGPDTGIYPIQDISEFPTEIIEDDSGYQRDQDDFDIAPPAPLPSIPIEESKPTPRAQGVPRRSSRSGNTGKMVSKTERETPAEEERFIPIEERPTQIIQEPKQASPRPMVLPPPESRGAQQTYPRSRQPALSRPASGTPTKGTGRGVVRGAPPARKKRGSGAYGVVVVLVLLALLVASLAYFVPSAVVTITLPARDFAHEVKLTTTARSQGPTVPGTVPADTLKKDFNKSGEGKATGNTQIGKGFATGSVIFTNAGNVSVTIPTGTVVATAGANGVQFVTTAEAVVAQAESQVGNTIPVPIKAQAQGEASNVDSDKITVITDASLKQIAATSGIPAPDLKLQVSNPDPTTGGGVGNATTVTAKDLDNTKKGLREQLQGEIDAWMKANVTSEDVSAAPVVTETLVNSPKEGQIVDKGTFSAQLKVSVEVLVVRQADLQAAALMQLNEHLRNDKDLAGAVIVVDAGHPLTINRKDLKVSGKVPALTLTFPASGKALQNIKKEEVQKLIAGKSLSNAETVLRTDIPDVQRIEIETTPKFVSWIPFRGENITVNLVPGTNPKSTGS